MRYLILFGIVVAAAAAIAALFRRAFGGRATIAVGVLLTLVAVVLFWFNKSDSVADTLIEHVADFTPPLISGSIVIGWWIGYALHGLLTRALR